MLPAHVKEGIGKAVAAMKSGKMKPGDTMIMKDKDDDGEEDMEHDNGEYHAMAVDVLEAIENKDAGALGQILEQICKMG